jgi:dTDP-4-amino-4,6-dideoxygalactose transaminase
MLGEKIDKAKFTRSLLEDFGVETGNIFYPPCHMQGVYKKLGAFSYGSLSTAEQVLSRTITLPMHVGLTNDDVEFVVDRVSFLVDKLSQN